jgi:hypothetical protein
MDKNIVGMRISRNLGTVETKLDDLLAEAGKLMAEVVSARVSLGESTIGSQRPIARLSSLQGHLVSARADAGRIHADLAKISTGRMDIPTECPAQTGCAEPTREAA